MQKRRHPSQRRAQERVALILQSTTEVLREQGIGAVTTNSIAARAGIPVSSIYQYFPNKVAILCALYREYLAGIVVVLEAFAVPENLGLPWPQFFTGFLQAVSHQETRENIDIEFEKALRLFPELVELEVAHREQMADRLADILRQLGSGWPKPRLRRMGLFIYEINGAVWSYRSLGTSSEKEYLEWGIAAILGVVQQCMPE